LSVAAASAPIAIGIPAPTDSLYPTSKLKVRITALPNDGTIYLADGVTPVVLGELLTVGELSTLTFAGGAGAAGQSRQLSYAVTDPAGTSATGAATLSVVANTLDPRTIPASLSVAADSGATTINIAAPTDPKYSAASLTVKVLGTPEDGTVLLADGVTRVTAGETLTVTQLTGLKFAPTAGVVAESGQFSYTVTDPAGASSLGGATLSVAPSGNVLTVGPGKQYSTIAAAIAASHNGDTIEVQAGTYTNDFAIINTKITLEGVGGMVNMVCTEQIPNGKAFFVTNADVTINNFSFTGAQVADQNGAGIRYQKGNLVLNYDSFFHNQDGLLGGSGLVGTITINNSEFADNGVSDPTSAGYGKTHDLYVTNIDTLTINNSYFHDANIGHEIKSYALNTIIENSRIDDGPAGTASYNVDLPNGGNLVLVNNVIEQGPLSQNSIMVSYGETGTTYSNSNLTIKDNTILNDLKKPAALFLQNDTTVTANITGNQFYGLAASQIAAGPNTQSSDTFLTTEPALNTSHPWSPETVALSPPPPPLPPPPPTPPIAPINLGLAVVSDQGAQGDTMTLSGLGVVGDTVKVSDGTTLLGSVTVSATGNWSLTTPALAIGNHALSEMETDSSGNVSPPSTALELSVTSGTPNAVTFYGTSSPIDFTGGAGNDTFIFSTADLTNMDTIKGGGSKDTLLMTSPGWVKVQGVRGVGTYKLASGGANTLYLGDENFIGMTGATIEVDGAADGNIVNASAVTGANNLVFVGGAGDDIIVPGTVATMTGGAGNNQFTFADIGTRTITDFAASAGNELVVRNSGFNLGVDQGLGTDTPKHLDASLFVANGGGTFTKTTQRFAYDTTAGALYYSANGSGSTKSAVVTLSDHATLTAGTLGNLYFKM